MKIKENDYVELQPNIRNFSKEDFVVEDLEYQMMLDHTNEEAVVTSVAIEYDSENSKFNYFDIRFYDGYEIFAISGIHLELSE